MQTLQAVFHHGNDQRRMDFTPDTDIGNGEIVNMGGTIGICTDTEGIKANTKGALATQGVFRIKKEAGAGVSFAIGVTVPWDDAAKNAVGSGGTFNLGRCIDQDSADDDDGVYVDINQVSVNA